MSAKWVARGHRRSCRRRTGAHLGLMEKPAKNEIFKKSWNWRIILMPAIVWQIFEYETNPITGNGNCVNWRKLGWKNSWNHFKLTYFWKVLAIWTTVGRWTQSRRRPRAASFLAAGSCTRHAPACPRSLGAVPLHSSHHYYLLLHVKPTRSSMICDSFFLVELIHSSGSLNITPKK